MRELWRDESGVTTVEYALLLVLVALVALGAWQSLGTGVNAGVNAASAAVNSGGFDGPPTP